MKKGGGFRSPVGRGERAKRGTEALADHQDQGATVKKKKEQRMSREVALGTTVHRSRHETGLSDVQLGHYARGPKSGRSMADEIARKREDRSSRLVVALGRVPSLACSTADEGLWLL